MTIQILTPAVAAQIAAGEVVERPASVVKELVENALDAGARRITIEARGGGLREIKVQDDGRGIPADEVVLAFERYGTSKLRQADDLWAIGTLGFRGEALPSIASVAQVICITRTPDAAVGTELRIAGSEVQDQGPRGCSPGTSISVRNLFYNTPVRRDYLRSEATEMGAISTVVQQYALAYPEARFTLLLDGRLALQTSGNGDLRETMIELYGLEVARQLLDVAADTGTGTDTIYVRGLISPPGLTRGSRSAMHLFINRRALQPRGPLVMVVSDAYHTLLMKGRHPVVVLDIHVHPSAVDVNVHPTKSEVRLRYQQRVSSLLGRAIRDALLANPDTQQWVDALAGDPAEGVQRRFELRQPASPDDPDAPDAQPAPAGGAAPPAWKAGASAWTTESRWDVGGPLRPDPVDAPEEMAPAAPAPPETAPVPTTPPRASLPPLRVVGQVGLTYIVAESPEGMYLVDQHAAHERITYERLLDQQRGGTVEVQELLMPQTVALPPAAAELLTRSTEALTMWGFTLEPWGEGLVRLRALPATLPLEQAQVALLEIADHLAGQGGSTPADWRDAMLTTLACHTSVRAGQTLSLEEMRRLLMALEGCTSPRTCPHGRPTMVLLTPGQLEKQFGRQV